MNRHTLLTALVLSMVAAACGSSDPDAVPDSIEPAPPEATQPPTTDAPTDDGAVSAAEIAGRWYPVAVDGVALDTTKGDYWEFDGTDTGLAISGYECNNFGTTGEPDTASASIVDGRLENVEIASTEMACEGIEHGPSPEDGAQLTVSDDGATLTVEGSFATIELSRTAPSAPTEPDVAAGSVDGPLMRHPEPSGLQAGMEAEIRGLLELEDDCLYVSSDDIGERYPVLWPAGTEWDAERDVVVLPTGDEIAVGDSASGGGGYLMVDAVEELAGSAAAEHAARCVDNTYGEIAVVNNFETAIAPS